MTAYCRSAALLVSLLCGTTAAAAEPVWFVVAETTPEHGDSFLLPLSDPQDIADARTIVAEGNLGGVFSIVGARIAAGGDGFNRDVLREGAPLWSWHVAEFIGFADLAMELCDGWPTFVEQDVEAYIANTEQICFWSYTVVAELDSAPAFAIADGLDGAWYDPATPGQGVFVDVMGAAGQLGLGWFAFDPQAPGNQRWWSAQGSHAGAVATLDLYRTDGGRFGAADPVQTTKVGEAQLTFTDCNHALLEFAFADGDDGAIPLQRVATAAGCVRR